MERWNHRTLIDVTDRHGGRGDREPIECHTVDQPFRQFNPRVAERYPTSSRAMYRANMHGTMRVLKLSAARVVVRHLKIRLDRSHPNDWKNADIRRDRDHVVRVANATPLLAVCREISVVRRPDQFLTSWPAPRRLHSWVREWGCPMMPARVPNGLGDAVK